MNRRNIIAIAVYFFTILQSQLMQSTHQSAEQNREPKIVKIYIMDGFGRNNIRPPSFKFPPPSKYIPMRKEERKLDQIRMTFFYIPEKIEIKGNFELHTPEVARGGSDFYIPRYVYKFLLSDNTLKMSIMGHGRQGSYSYTFTPTPSNEFVLILGPHTGGYMGNVGYLPAVMLPYGSEEYQLIKTFFEEDFWLPLNNIYGHLMFILGKIEFQKLQVGKNYRPFAFQYQEAMKNSNITKKAKQWLQLYRAYLLHNQTRLPQEELDVLLIDSEENRE